MSQQIYEVVVRHGDKVTTQYLVASHIREVIKHLEADLGDEASEVIKIEAKAPILRILP